MGLTLVAQKRQKKVCQVILKGYYGSIKPGLMLLLQLWSVALPVSFLVSHTSPLLHVLTAPVG